MAWIDALDAETLRERGKILFRWQGKQILVLDSPNGPLACANRCPHEGYPLSEGTLSGERGCVLTCNWHNWKFDLSTGETLIGGDTLTRYPAKIEGGRVLLEIAPVDPALRGRRILADLPKALSDEDQQRLVRESARLEHLGLDPLDAVRVAVDWASDRLEFGTTHAHAVAADWLDLRARAETTPDERLAALGELLGHLAEDGKTDRLHPYPEGEKPWSAEQFLRAVEAEDEAAALPLLRGALAAGQSVETLFPVFLEAALAHYADFGHSLIYVVKTRDLAARLGPESDFALLAPLVRSLIMAGRDDLIPEFRDYALRLKEWGKPEKDAPPIDATALRRTTAKSAMALVASWSGAQACEAIFAALLETGAWQLLHVNEAHLNAIDVKIAETVGWLDFTHTLTFAEAGLRAVETRPDLWPALLLQLACFVGRNAAYCDADQDTARFRVDEAEAFIAARTKALFDHGRDRFILSAHLVKTLLAAEKLATSFPDQAPMILAAVHRFLTASIKRRHLLRVAKQMRAFVAEE